MSNVIQIARGLKSKMPILKDGQQYFCTDTNETYIGNNGTNVTTGSAGSDTARESKTYEELMAMAKAATLKPGCQYILTDYQTKYQQPVTLTLKTANNTEKLVLTANGYRDIEPRCSSLDYPYDTIWYDFKNTKCEDNVTPRNGFIRRRHDIQRNINAPHDWRTIQYARFEPDWASMIPYVAGMNVTAGKFYVITYPWASNAHDKVVTVATKTVKTTSYTDPGVLLPLIQCTPSQNDLERYPMFDDFRIMNYTVKANKSNAYQVNGIDYNRLRNIYIDDYYVDNLLTLSNNVIPGSFTKGIVGNIYIGPNCYNNTFIPGRGGGVDVFSYLNNDHVTLGQSCTNNIFRHCKNLAIGDGCTLNIFNAMLQSQVGSYCSANVFSTNLHMTYNCMSNSTIGSNCSQNVVLSCSGVTIGDNSNNNRMYGDNNALDTVNINIGNNCSTNTIGIGCNNLTVINGAMNNKNISAIPDFKYNTGTLTIEKNINGLPVYRKLDATNQPIYTVIP